MIHLLYHFLKIGEFMASLSFHFFWQMKLFLYFVISTASILEAPNLASISVLQSSYISIIYFFFSFLAKQQNETDMSVLLFGL